jgi:hypothetical protein
MPLALTTPPDGPQALLGNVQLPAFCGWLRDKLPWRAVATGPSAGTRRRTPTWPVSEPGPQVGPAGQ